MTKRGPIEKQVNAHIPLDDVQWELIRADIAEQKAKRERDMSIWKREQAQYGANMYRSNREFWVEQISERFAIDMCGPDPRIVKS